MEAAAYCPACGSRLPDNALFCSQCAAPVKCQACSRLLPTGAAFCSDCGTPIRQIELAQPKRHGSLAPKQALVAAGVVVAGILAWAGITQIRSQMATQAAQRQQAAVCSELATLRQNLISQGVSFELGDLVDVGGMVQVQVAKYFFGPSAQVPTTQILQLNQAVSQRNAVPRIGAQPSRAFYILAKIDPLGIPGTVVDLIDSTKPMPSSGDLRVAALASGICP